MKEEKRPLIEAEPDFAKSKSGFMLKTQRVEERRGRKCSIS